MLVFATIYDTCRTTEDITSVTTFVTRNWPTCVGVACGPEMAIAQAHSFTTRASVQQEADEGSEPPEGFGRTTCRTLYTVTDEKGNVLYGYGYGTEGVDDTTFIR